jgi:hypothetical protein
MPIAADKPYMASSVVRRPRAGRHERNIAEQTMTATKITAATLSAALAVLALAGFYAGVVLGWPALALAADAAILLLAGPAAMWLWATSPVPAAEWSWSYDVEAGASFEYEPVVGVSAPPLRRVKFDWGRFEQAFRAYAQAQE